jgi:hypothetical protein
LIDRAGAGLVLVTHVPCASEGKRVALGIEVNPVIRTAEEWESDDTGFAAEVRARPTIELVEPAA